jgi:hypothetical protein
MIMLLCRWFCGWLLVARDFREYDMIWKMSIIQVYSKGTCSGLGWGEDIKIWCDGRKVEWVQSREVQYFSFFLSLPMIPCHLAMLH